MIKEEQQDQAALYALGILDAEEAYAVEAALAQSSELRDLVRELREAAASVAHGSDPRPVPSGLKQRVMNAVAAPVATPPVVPPTVPWIPWAIAAALALSCGALALQQSRLQRERSGLANDRSRWEQERSGLLAGRERLTQERSRLEADRDKLQRELAAVRASDPFGQAVIYVLGPAGNTRGKGIVAWEPSRQDGYLKLTNMPRPVRGRDYQLWAVDANHKDPVSAGVIRVDNNGTAQIRFKPTDEARQVKAFAISVEREGGSTKKEGPIVMVGTS